ncbi:hypothetical protein TREMEDRAFT_63280 [Tremella mesenterica DSM 1558]|uniref:uncharacterized protein n=1 Tax=Tremella mesenterica (strain ATCC 24925 / CBS 8224 / DSM 1558 / NBRC 9311 / NRRL Y-6157 / RJB 2259-6 / UBC 559-6) TaxID=578456 RepID=UPI0003F48E7E|nr:uncharacterized protein TREMEDRAFT_63280 [Tremella mesenterica DSM 1558]EIW68817.1 hypothetical protein TREMEDRAFT_63280 [Tremella mesenterica DSM 1558]
MSISKPPIEFLVGQPDVFLLFPIVSCQTPLMAQNETNSHARKRKFYLPKSSIATRRWKLAYSVKMYIRITRDCYPFPGTLPLHPLNIICQQDQGLWIKVSNMTQYLTFDPYHDFQEDASTPSQKKRLKKSNHVSIPSVILIGRKWKPNLTGQHATLMTWYTPDPWPMIDAFLEYPSLEGDRRAEDLRDNIWNMALAISHGELPPSPQEWFPLYESAVAKTLLLDQYADWQVTVKMEYDVYAPSDPTYQIIRMEVARSRELSGSPLLLGLTYNDGEYTLFTNAVENNAEADILRISGLKGWASHLLPTEPSASDTRLQARIFSAAVCYDATFGNETRGVVFMSAVQQQDAYDSWIVTNIRLMMMKPQWRVSNSLKGNKTPEEISSSKAVNPLKSQSNKGAARSDLEAWELDEL